MVADRSAARHKANILSRQTRRKPSLGSIVGYIALNPPLPLLLEDLILDPVSTRRSATVYENISLRKKLGETSSVGNVYS